MNKKLLQKPNNVVKIVLFGPESTGKTTLARQLADHYQTVWAPEYAREYLQKKWDTKRQVCEHEDLLPIALGQMKSENRLSKKANKVLICDTDLLETKVYAEEYYDGSADDDLEYAAVTNTYNLYLLTYIDIPWKNDHIRDRPGQREKMFNAFEKALKKYNRKYHILKGDKKSRFEKAVTIIDEQLSKNENAGPISKAQDSSKWKGFLNRFFKSKNN